MADTKISNLTTDSSPDRTADYVPTYDASAVATKKVLLSNLGGYTLFANCAASSPADSTTYYFGPHWTRALATTAANHKIRIPRTGKITRISIETLIITTLGSAENITASFRLNDTTDTTITSVMQLDQTSETFTNSGLSIAVTDTDYGCIKLAMPAFATNPIDVVINALILVT